MVQYTRFPAHPQSAGLVSSAPTRPSRTKPSPRHLDKVTEKRGNAVLLWVFLIAMVLPLQFSVGPLLFTPVRVLMVFGFPILIVRWLAGHYGPRLWADWLLLAFVSWTIISMTANHGFSRLEFTGITAIEIMGGYLFGRALVRGPTDMLQMIRFLKIFLLIMLVPTALEALAANPVVLKFFNAIGSSFFWVSSDPSYGQRMGMWRAQGVFPHPILYGIFCASTFALIYYAPSLKTGKPAGMLAASPSGILTFFSLSSGAFLSVMAQCGLIIWNWMFRHIRRHWYVLIGLIMVLYVVVDLISDRTPFEVFITYAAFSAHNGYMRINIFIYGMENVWANPVFGIGSSNWERPDWMHAASVDNFWLLMAMRYGLPGFLLFSASWSSAIITNGRLILNSGIPQNLRRGWVITMIASAIALITVHVWGSIFIWMMFLLGAAGWLTDYARSAANAAEEGETDLTPTTIKSDTARCQQTKNRLTKRF